MMYPQLQNDPFTSCKVFNYQAQICFPGCLQSLPILYPIVGLLPPRETRRAVSDGSVQEGGVADESCCDWSSKACCVLWAQVASWACSP